jgi:hypothetical protein
MQSKDFTIGVLSITAVILLTGFILIDALAPSPAVAAGQSAITGDYIISTGQLDDITDLVYVLDSGAQRMNVYGYDVLANNLELIQQIDVRQRQQARPEQPQ